MKEVEEKFQIDYFEVEGTPGGNQEWCTDFWMYLGGCAALAACDVSICLAKNAGCRECYPFSVNKLTKKQYVQFAMMMKPYIHPRIGGVSRLSIFTKGYGRYLREHGYEAEFHLCAGDETYEKACTFMKEELKNNLPIPFLLLRHRDKKLKDLNWHWFMITGYTVKDNRMILRYHTYGEVQEVDFETLWNTGMFQKGGMTSISKIRKITEEKA